MHIHHIKHWADGGETAVHNGVCLCSYHHTLVHEGGYSIERVETNSPRQNEQFVKQQHNDDKTQFDFEKSLRNDKASFNTVRKLSPTRFRYQIIDSHGQVITGRSGDDSDDTHQVAENPSTYCFRVSANSDAFNENRSESENVFDYTRVYKNDANPEDSTTTIYCMQTLDYGKFGAKLKVDLSLLLTA